MTVKIDTDSNMCASSKFHLEDNSPLLLCFVVVVIVRVIVGLFVHIVVLLALPSFPYCYYCWWSNHQICWLKTKRS